MYNLSKKTLLGVTVITFFMCTLFFTTPDAFATRAKKAGIKVDSLKLSAANPVFNCPDTTTVTLSIYYTVKVVSKYSVNKKLNLFYWRGNPKAESDLPGSGGGKRYIARETYTIDTDGKYKDSSYVDTVKFKIWCASCCDKGIKGNRSTANQNNKKKATLRVHFYGKKAKVTVECKHEDSHARLTPRDTLGTIGSDATCSIELDNLQPTVHARLGRLLRQELRFSAAVDHLKLALRYDPLLPLTHLDTAKTKRAQGQHDQAIEHFEKFLDFRTRYPQFPSPDIITEVNLAHLFVDDQVKVALPIPGLHISQAMPFLRQRLHRL